MKRSYIGLALGALVRWSGAESAELRARSEVVSLTITPTTSTFASRFTPPLPIHQQYVATATYTIPPPPRTSLVRRPGPLITTWPRCRLRLFMRRLAATFPRHGGRACRGYIGKYS